MKTAWQSSSVWPRRWLILLLVGLILATGPLQSQIAPSLLPFTQPAVSQEAGGAAGVGIDETYTLYEVRPGDNLFRIARSFKVDVNQLVSINGIVNPELIRVGQKLKIPKTGVGQNPADVLVQHPAGAVPAAVMQSDLPSRSAEWPVGALDEGLNWLPSGSLPAEDPEETRSWQWPLVGTITLGYGSKDADGFHHGLDIAGKIGDPILAAAGGKVVFAGMRPVYGRTVVINHGNGLVSLYAHTSKLLVKVGDKVNAEQEIAEVGNSGNSRGSHLHFEIYLKGKTTNPMNYLPGR